MKVSIKTTNFKLTPGVRKAVEEKISPLDRFIPHIKVPLKAFVEVGLINRHHQKGDIYYAEVNINLPGRIIRSEAKEESVYKAVNTVKDELQLLLKKYKKKQMAKREKALVTLKKKSREA